MGKPILCLDFDGVLHRYDSGWKGADVIPDAPTTGMVDFLNASIDVFDVQIFSSRSHQPGGIAAMKEWLRHYVQYEFDCEFHHGASGDFERANLILNSISFPLEKPPAMLTIDDRALCFTGSWSDFHPDILKEFQPWNKRKATSQQSVTGLAGVRNVLRTLLTRMASLLMRAAARVAAQ